MSRIVRNVSYRITEAPVPELLRQISMEAPMGAVTLIAGHTGSGKSTLLQLLAGLKEPTAGEILVDGAKIKANSSERKKQLREVLLHTSGYVHQYPEHQFFLPRVEEELGYGLRSYRLQPEERNRRIRQAAAVCRVPDELMSRSPFQLSGGQKRRVALAAVLAPDPDWLLLDEPTAGLDSDMAGWMIGQMKEWARQRGEKGRGGIIVAAHDLNLFLPAADQVVLLRNGSILGQWSPAELSRRPEVLMEAGLGLPECVRLSRFSGSAGLNPASVAEGIIRKLAAGASSNADNNKSETAELSVSMTRAAEDSIVSPVQSQAENMDVASLTSSKRGAHPDYNENPSIGRLLALDPRAKWLVYLLFSLTVLMKPHMAVSGAALLAIAAVGAGAGLPYRRWLKPLLPFLVFMLAAFIISGIQISWGSGSNPLSHTRFHLPQAIETLNRLGALLPVMAGGVLFNACTTPLSIQKGLDALLRLIPRFGRAAEAIGLAVALMFRFLRFIPGELSRFAMLASVRSRSKGKNGKLRLRQLPSFFTPMLLSIMQHAEELSVALEAKGWGRKGVERTNAAPLRFVKRDWAACVVGCAVVAGLAGIRWMVY